MQSIGCSKPRRDPANRTAEAKRVPLKWKGLMRAQRKAVETPEARDSFPAARRCAPLLAVVM